MNEREYILAFSAFSGIGTIRFEKLFTTFGSARGAWEADVREIQKAIGPLTAQHFDAFRKNFDREKYVEAVKKKDIYWLVPTDKEYPKLLKQLNNVIPAQAGIQSFGSAQDKEDGSRIKSGMTRAPFILFVKGNLHLVQNERTIGIVGTRKVTAYGIEVTKMFTKELVEQDMIIISGMALGVDGIAHQTALENNGRTIAVLGSGVDVPTPREHARLYQSILDSGGAIVSTFSPGEDAGIGSFPARNAIIAGLSRGVLITEGAEDSGSLITANDAKKFGRFLFAVPGQITSHLSKGPNNLIKQGALAVSSAQDILDQLQLSLPVFQPKHVAQSLISEEQEVLDLLAEEPLHFNAIVRKLQKDSQAVGSLLSLMELKGLIHQLSDSTYSL